MSSKLYTIVLWGSSKKQFSEILYRVQSKFKVKEYGFREYSSGGFIDFLNKFYPHRKFNNNSIKIWETENNCIFYMVVEDAEPFFVNNINQTCLKLKKYFRHKYFQNYLHISDNSQEAFENYHNITNKSSDDFNILSSNKDLNIVKKLFSSKQFDVIEYEKVNFQNINNVFKLLNRYEKWLVLRNWENIYEEVTSSEHGDVDILVEDFFRTIQLLNAKPKFNDAYRVHYFVNIENKQIPFDVRYLGDNYYNLQWEKDLLDNRIKDDNIFRSSYSDYFYSLVYHALIHKRNISQDYINKFLIYGKDIFIFNQVELNNNPRKYLKKILNLYMKKKLYSVVEPIDLSINYHPNKIGFYYRIFKRLLLNKLSQISFLNNLNFKIERFFKIKLKWKILKTFYKAN